MTDKLETIRVIERTRVFSAPWFDVISKTIARKEEEPGQPYYVVKPRDYIVVLAVTKEDHVVLVRQYRPTVERITLELPGGLLDSGEDPKLGAARELLEETGYAASKLEWMGSLIPDTGRLENCMWCYFAKDVVLQGKVREEEGTEALLYSREELFKAVADGTFAHALNLAVVLLAVSQNRIAVPSAK